MVSLVSRKGKKTKQYLMFCQENALTFLWKKKKTVGICSAKALWFVL